MTWQIADDYTIESWLALSQDERSAILWEMFKKEYHGPLAHLLEFLTPSHHSTDSTGE